MKSTIKIDLDLDNMPILVVNFVPSEDVRDKMVERFLNNLYNDWPERHAHDMGLATVMFHTRSDNGSIKAHIRTLGLDALVNTDIDGFAKNARRWVTPKDLGDPKAVEKEYPLKW